MQKLLYQPLVVAIITLVTIVLCISLYISTFQLRGSSQRVAILKTEVEKQHTLTENLAAKFQVAQTPYAQEVIIRDQLLMQKPGEYVVQVPNLAPVVVHDTSVLPTPSPWEAWKKLLF